MGHKISELSEALSLRKALTHTLRRQNTLEIPVQQRENSSKGGTPHEARQTEKVRECARIHVCVVRWSVGHVCELLESGSAAAHSEWFY